MSHNIETIVMLTRNRLSAAVSNLVSYIRNITSANRDCTFAICDDSPRSSFRSYAAGIASLHKARILYAGNVEKDIYISHLAARGFKRSIIEYALRGAGAFATYGANRNASLLQTAGHMMFSTDDDVACRISRSATLTEGLRIVADGEFENVSSYRTRTDALNAFPEVDCDLLSLHETLLGRSFELRSGDLTNASSSNDSTKDGDIDVIANRVGPSYTVRISLNGLLGDCGGNDFDQRLTTLLRQKRDLSEEEIDSFLLTREIGRVANQPTLVRSETMMSTSFGLDNRNISAPFFPNFRDEDSLFGYMMSYVAPESMLGVIPYLLLHSPPEERKVRTRPVSGMINIGISTVIEYELRRNIKSVSATSPSAKIVASGEILLDLAKSRHAGLRGKVKSFKLQILQERIRSLETLRARYNPPPSTALRRLVDNLLIRSQNELTKVDSSIMSWADADWDENSYDIPLTMIELYGGLLLSWPDIFEEAKTLKQQGVNLGQWIRL